jgi:hypothetical protein
MLLSAACRFAGSRRSPVVIRKGGDGDGERLHEKCGGGSGRRSTRTGVLGLEHGLVPAPGCDALWCLCAVLRKGWYGKVRTK